MVTPSLSFFVKLSLIVFNQVYLKKKSKWPLISCHTIWFFDVLVKTDSFSSNTRIELSWTYMASPLDKIFDQWATDNFSAKEKEQLEERRRNWQKGALCYYFN